MNKPQNIGDHSHKIINGSREDFYKMAAERIEEARVDPTCKACIIYTIRDDGRNDGALEVGTLSSLAQQDLDAFIVEMANNAMARKNPTLAAIVDAIMGVPADKADDHGGLEALRDHAEDEDQDEEELADIFDELLNEDPHATKKREELLKNETSPWHKDDKQ